MPKSRGKRARQGGGGKQEPDAKKRRTQNEEDAVSLFDVQPKVGMKLDARDVDYIWSSATIIRVSHFSKKEHTSVTIRFDGWGKKYDETLEWNVSNRERLAPLYSFTKCVKCLVDLLPKSRKNPTDEELDTIPDTAPEMYCNLWPCQVQFRMPHPLVEGMDDEEDCTFAQSDLSCEPHLFIQPYNANQLPRHVRHSLKEGNGMWIKAKRCKPWKSNPTELGVLPSGFMETFHFAKMDTNTPGVLFHAAIDKGSLLKEKYRVHSRQGSIVRDGALREEEEEYNNVEEEEEGDEDERKVPAQIAATQQQQQPMVETSAKPESKTSSCIVM